MIRQLLLMAIIITMTATAAPAMEKGGISVPDTFSPGDTEVQLVMNGAGIRKKIGFKVYVGSLYLQEKTTDSKEVINVDEPMAITMDWLRNVAKEKIAETFSEGFKYSAGTDLDSLKPQIDMFLNSLKDASKSDKWKLIYTPALGTQLYFNDKLVVTIGDIAFKRALFGIWLLETDAFTGDENLRDGMLGK
ncbi:chalcone isomerase family protein [bacterium]|nr:chalcone isomerase family protein [candidate division CSSED10-310 bacterium]